MITKFRVKNYKSIAWLDIPLTKIHVIIGRNGSGKTSLLECLYAYSKSTENYKNIAAAFSGVWQGMELVHSGASEGEEYVELSGVLQAELGGADRRPPVNYGFAIDFGPFSPHEDPPVRCNIEMSNDIKSINPWNVDPTESTSPGSSSFQRVYRQELGDIRRRLGDVQLYRFDARQLATPASIDQNRRFRMEPDGFGLATLLDDILGNNPNDFIRLSEIFCEMFPEYERVTVRTDQGYERAYSGGNITSSTPMAGKAIYFKTREGGFVRASQASDGAMLFLGFLSLFHTPRPPKLLLIEEPENGIYPKRLAEVIGILKYVTGSTPHPMIPQIILTTHSPYILTDFSPEEVTVMSRVGSSCIARPLRDAPHIHERLSGGDFYLGELWYNLSEEELFGDEITNADY